MEIFVRRVFRGVQRPGLAHDVHEVLRPSRDDDVRRRALVAAVIPPSHQSARHVERVGGDFKEQRAVSPQTDRQTPDRHRQPPELRAQVVARLGPPPPQLVVAARGASEAIGDGSGDGGGALGFVLHRADGLGEVREEQGEVRVLPRAQVDDGDVALVARVGLDALEEVEGRDAVLAFFRRTRVLGELGEVAAAGVVEAVGDALVEVEGTRGGEAKRRRLRGRVRFRQVANRRDARVGGVRGDREAGDREVLGPAEGAAAGTPRLPDERERVGAPTAIASGARGERGEVGRGRRVRARVRVREGGGDGHRHRGLVLELRGRVRVGGGGGLRRTQGGGEHPRHALDVREHPREGAAPRAAAPGARARRRAGRGRGGGGGRLGGRAGRTPRGTLAGEVRGRARGGGGRRAPRGGVRERRRDVPGRVRVGGLAPVPRRGLALARAERAREAVARPAHPRRHRAPGRGANPDAPRRKRGAADGTRRSRPSAGRNNETARRCREGRAKHPAAGGVDRPSMS